MNLQTQQLKGYIDKALIVVIIVASAKFNSNAQQIKAVGTHPPDSAVIKLFENYFTATFDWKTVPERDSKRKSMVSADYFYHGMDGTPIDFAGLTARQTKNKLKLEKVVKFDVILHQYENTAIITYKNWLRGTDRGNTIEGYGSAAMVFSRENGVWKVIADILGREPYVPNPPPGLPLQKQQ